MKEVLWWVLWCVVGLLFLAAILLDAKVWGMEEIITHHFCPGGDEYYLKDVDLDDDGLPEKRLMGRIGGAGQLQDPLAVMHMERGRTGEVSVRMKGGETREMSSLEFHGRFRSPCGFLGSR